MSVRRTRFQQLTSESPVTQAFHDISSVSGRDELIAPNGVIRIAQLLVIG
jgi:hypothetical protein